MDEKVTCESKPKLRKMTFSPCLAVDTYAVDEVRRLNTDAGSGGVPTAEVDAAIRKRPSPALPPVAVPARSPCRRRPSPS